MPSSTGKRAAAGLTLAVAVAALLGMPAAAPTPAGAPPPAAGDLDLGRGAAARQGSYLAAERLLRRAIAAAEEAHGPDHPGLPPRSTGWPRSTKPPAAGPRPSRSSSAPSPSTRRRTAPGTPSSPAGSTTWRCSTGPPAARPWRRRCSRAPSRSSRQGYRRATRSRRRSAGTTPTSSSGSATGRKPPRSGPGPRRSGGSASRRWVGPFEGPPARRLAATWPAARPPDRQPRCSLGGHTPSTAKRFSARIVLRR
jgi:hypothetical protein